jgi:hypothetical protein
MNRIYRNKVEFVNYAAVIFCAISFLSPAEAEEDGVPRLKPMTMTLRFYAFDPQHGAIADNVFLRAIASGLQERSKIPIKNQQKSSSVSDLKGFKAFYSDTERKLYTQYQHLEVQREGKYGQILDIPITFQIQRNGDMAEITLTSSASATTYTYNYIFPSTTPKLDDRTLLVDDFESIFQSSATIAVSARYVFSGEVDCNFKPDAIKANFDRLATKSEKGYPFNPKLSLFYVWKSDLIGVPFAISVVPYRDGSKVIFEGLLPYRIATDGGKVGFDSSAKFREYIAKISND